MFKIGSVIIDSLKNENTDFANEITSKAVEEGVNITDNINHKPLKLSATCVLAGSTADIRYQQLKILAAQDELITYYGSLEPVLTNMAIESISNKRNVSLGDGFEFDITLLQVKIATTKTFKYYALTDPATGKIVENKAGDAGKNQAKQEDIDESSVKSSVMYTALKSFGLVGGGN